MSEQEIKDRINYFYLQIDGTYDFPNSKEGDLLKMVNTALTEQATLIDQQAQEIRALGNQLTTEACKNAENELTKTRLELAVKALEWYADKKNHEWSDKGELAQSTLDQIRRERGHENSDSDKPNGNGPDHSGDD